MASKVAKETFERSAVIYESAILTFKGVDGWDVYNCSVPFMYKGARHIYGRVEKREEWANSHVRLFVETGKDEFSVVPDLNWELEDPYVQRLKDTFVIGGTHVRKMSGEVKSYYGFFYQGDPSSPTYFTSGPDFMKDIRIVELADGRIGVFSRRRVGSEASIGFAVVSELHELGVDTISRATPLDNLLAPGDWGGVNQAYLLSSGLIGCIAHYSYNDTTPSGDPLKVYTNYCFVLDPQTLTVTDGKYIGTRRCYPSAPSKKPILADCVFTSGLVVREDGKCDLYSGIGDVCEGRLTIDYPFEGHGTIVGPPLTYVE